MRIRLRERDHRTRRWSILWEQQLVEGIPAIVENSPDDPAFELNEVNELEISIGPWPDRQETKDRIDVRVSLGGVLVASSLAADGTDRFFHFIENMAGDELLGCRGRLAQDWVGLTEFEIRLARNGVWSVLFLARPVRIVAGKIAQDDYEQLCIELAKSSAAALLDVYGKTYLGLESEYGPGESAPVATLHRVRGAIDQLSVALREIAAQPVCRLKTRRVREPALAEQGVSDLTLEEACFDPSLLVKSQGRVVFREQVREVADAHYNLPENRLISSFLDFLVNQLTDIDRRLTVDIGQRQERKAYRNRPATDGSKSWWETEDLPRINELRAVRESVTTMRRDVVRLQRYEFLPPTEILRELPPATPLLRTHHAYAAAYRVISSHFRAFRVRLDGGHLLVRAKSLPVLYEWWCALEVIRVMRSLLQLRDASASDRSSPFRSSSEGRGGFVIEFDVDQTIDFEDANGKLLRFRYTPSYRHPSNTDSVYGLLGPDLERTPDMAIEVFGDDPAVPELIVVLDAKYTLKSHREKLEEVRLKYGKIGIFETGRILSRQVWAMVPRAPEGARLRGPAWSADCSVDNRGFWSENYDMQSLTCGVLRARPQAESTGMALDGLLERILSRAGVMINGR